MQVPPLGGKEPLQEGVAAAPVFLPGKFHGRGACGYGPGGRKESTTAEGLSRQAHARTHT